MIYRPYRFCLLIFLFFSACRAGEDTPQIMTVQGPLPADSMGVTLIHEHVFLDWTPADSIQPEQWKPKEAFYTILPYLWEANFRGVQTFLECTPSYLGRSPLLLRRLSDSSGLHILTNTGYYGARNDQHLPRHTFTETADQLADRWVGEYEKGIEGTGIRPGFIKIGVDGDSILSAIDEKLVRAAALTHLRTGLTIVGHTGPDAPARSQLAILAEEGVAPEAFVWTHAQGGTLPLHLELAEKGAWISLDGLGWVPETSLEEGNGPLQKYVDQLINLKSIGLLHRALISHDAGWYTHGEPAGGDDYRPYTNIFTLLLPALKKNGFSEADIHQLLVENPREAYSIRVRAITSPPSIY